jgi:rRNA maturation protein Rpf1
MNMQETHCIIDYWFFNNICIIGEVPEECKNCIAIAIHKNSEKQKVENYREISLLNFKRKRNKRVPSIFNEESTESFICLRRHIYISHVLLLCISFYAY